MTIKTTGMCFTTLLLSQLPLGKHNEPYEVTNVTVVHEEPDHPDNDILFNVFRVSGVGKEEWTFFISSIDYETWETTLFYPTGC